jgi:succinate dehydrogenase hydrophobic anchor subunit
MRESKLWFWHLLSAAAILVLLGVHMGIMHLSAVAKVLGIGSGDPIQSAEVFRRSRQLLFSITYILLLGAALFHGLYGLRSMLFELSFPKNIEKMIGGLCTLAGIALFFYGGYVAVRVFQMKVGL